MCGPSCVYSYASSGSWLVAVVLCFGGMRIANGDAVFYVPPDVAPDSIGAGDVLHLDVGGTLPKNFSATAGSTLNMRGGSIGDFSGSFGDVNISGGTVGSNFSAGDGSLVAITGGSIGFSYSADQGSTTIIGGGEIAILFNADAGAEVRLFGLEFTLGGSSINGLNQSGDTVVIADRGNQLLAGTLSDGSPINFTLSSFNFNTAATLSATLFLPGDFNRNGIVDPSDFAIWSSQYGTTVAAPGDGADGNLDRVINAADYVVWRDRLGSSLPGSASLASGSLASGQPVPEPATIWAVLLGVGLALCVKPRPLLTGKKRPTAA
ncbi:MAG: hypothetical protein ACR2NU_06680 [Aeoliella sp.]